MTSDMNTSFGSTCEQQHHAQAHGAHGIDQAPEQRHNQSPTTSITTSSAPSPSTHAHVYACIHACSYVWIHVCIHLRLHPTNLQSDQRNVNMTSLTRLTPTPTYILLPSISYFACVNISGMCARTHLCIFPTLPFRLPPHTHAQTLASVARPEVFRMVQFLPRKVLYGLSNSFAGTSALR